MSSFDTFLSHNSQDKPLVRELADALVERGLRPWLDERELVPGRPWQEALEEIIQTTRTAVVTFGPAGLGPWEEPEMRACLSEFVQRRLPVIPVLLPGAPTKPELPLFLKAFTWVDLRGGLTSEGLDRLEWGVTGKKPISAARSPSGPPAPSSSAAPPSGNASEHTSASRQSAGATGGRALAVWKEKLEFLLMEEAKAAGAAQRFELQQGIREARAKIQELEG